MRGEIQVRIPQLAAVLSGGRVSASCRSLLFVRLTIQTPQFKDELHDLESRSANLRSVPYRMKHTLSQNALRTSDKRLAAAEGVEPSSSTAGIGEPGRI